MSKDLSICIPTFNRASSLGKTVEAISEAIFKSGLQSKIEICISNNGSNDETVDVLQNACLKSDCIRFQSHDSNLGYQKNTRSVIEMASSEWVYVISDDDQILEGAIEFLVKLTSSSGDLFVFNCDSGDGKKSLGFASDREAYLRTPEDVLSQLNPFQLSFMGNLMFRRTPLLNSLNESDLLSAYPLTIAAWRILKKSGAVIWDAPVVSGNHDNRNWLVWQPIFTSIDMARILSADSLLSCKRRTVFKTYITLVKSIPRAVYRIRTRRVPNKIGNAFREVSLKNIWNIYQCSLRARTIATFLLFISSIMPLSVLKRILNEVEISSNTEMISLDGLESTIS